jgi:hypothetical protein
MAFESRIVVAILILLAVVATSMLFAFVIMPG